MHVHVRPRHLAIAACLALAAACGGTTREEAAPAPAATAPAPEPVDPATAGTVTGAITFEGTPPARDPIRMVSDPYCMKQGQKTLEHVVVGDKGTLQNVFVYVKDGLGDRRFPVPTTPVVLDQQGCTYVPHVFGIQVGQPLELANGDETLHNVHAIPEQNREFNRGMAQKGATHTHTFSTAEVMVPFTCDVHKWMSAWAGVLDHPFYAVTNGTGSFELKGLPPGTYTIEAWHEKLGTQTQTVTIGAKETRDIAFTFKS